MNKRNSRLAALVVLILAALVAWMLLRSPKKTEVAAGGSKLASPGNGGVSSGTATINRARVELPPAPSRVAAPIKPKAVAVPGPRIVGRVVMKASESVPVAGAAVYIAHGETEEVPFATTTSDEDGNFEFSGIQPGGMRYLYAIKERLSSTERVEGAERVLVPPESKDVGPFILKMIPAPVLTLRVMSEATKAPIAGAKVELFDFSRRAEKTGANGEIKFTTTPEELALRVSAPKHATASEKVDMSSGKDVTHEVALKAGGSIHGIVSNEAAQPVKDVSMAAQMDNDSFGGMKTDEKGAYSIDSLPLGKVLKIYGYTPGAIFGSQISKVATLTPEKPDQEINFTIKKPAKPVLVEAQKLGIKGTVLDEDKKPLKGAIAMYGQLVIPRKQHYADEDGKFFLKDIDPNEGERHLTVFCIGYSGEQIIVEPGPLDNPPDVTVTLKKGHWVKGRVVDEQKRPIANVRVTPYMFDMFMTPLVKMTNEEGKFEVDTLTDNADFSFEAKGYSAKNRIKIPLDKDNDEVVLTGQGMIAGVVVDDATNQPVKSFNIKTSYAIDRQPGDEPVSISYERGQKGEFFNDEGGHFVLKDITANGAVSLTADADDYSIKILDRVVAKTESQLKPIEIRLKKSSLTYQGAVVSGEFAPVVGADVTILVHMEKVRDLRGGWFDWQYFSRESFGYTAAFRKTIKTNNDGLFLFENVPEDRPIDVIAMADGFTNTRIIKLEEIKEEERLKMIVTMPKAGRIFGTVDHDRFPTAQSTSLGGDGTQIRYGSASIQEGGSGFNFEKLPPGKFRLDLYGRGAQMGRYASADTLYTKTVDLAEGQELEVTLGDDDLYKVSGVVKLGTAPLSRGVVVLRIQTGTRGVQRSATADDAGHFAIERIQPDTYEMVVADAESIRSDPNGNAVWNSPYKQPLEVGKADIDREFVFDKFSDVRGRVVNLPSDVSYLLFNSSAPSDGSTPTNFSAKPESSGKFIFKAVRPDVYRLRYSSPKVSGTIRTDIAVTKGADLDLGELTIDAGGTLRVLVTGNLPASSSRGTITVSTSPAGTDSPSMSGVGVANIPSGETIGTIEHHPAGSYKVSVSAYGRVGDPAMQDVEIAQGQVTEITAALRAVTGLGIDGVVDKAEVASVVATPQGGGQPVTFQQGDLSYALPREAAFALYTVAKPFTLQDTRRSVYIAARDLPPGLWEIKIASSDGKHWSKVVELKTGEEARAHFELQ